MTPSVAVVIPVFNRADMISGAIRSAREHGADELIVVDDGSTDGSGDEAAAHGGVRVVRTENRGRAAARNTGVGATGADWIAFLDSDDEWLPDHLERLLHRAHAVPSASVVVGHVTAIDERGEPDPAVTALHREIVEELERRNASPEAMAHRPGVLTSAMMVRRSALVDAGGFDERLSANEDWDLWLRLSLSAQWAFVAWPPITRYRLHDGNTPPRERALSVHALVHDGQAYRLLDRRARAELDLHDARSLAALGDPVGAVRGLARAVRQRPGVVARSIFWRLGLAAITSPLRPARVR